MAVAHSPSGARELYLKRFGKFCAIRNYPTKVFYLDDPEVRSKMKYLERTIIANALAGRGAGLLTEDVPVTLTAYFDEPLTRSLHGQLIDSDSEEKEREVEDLRKRNSALSDLLEQYQPHKQFLRTSLAFLLFFSATLTIQMFGGIWLMSYSLAWSGIAVSAATVLLSYLAAIDWQDWRSRRNMSH